MRLLSLIALVLVSASCQAGCRTILSNLMGLFRPIFVTGERPIKEVVEFPRYKGAEHTYIRTRFEIPKWLSKRKDLPREPVQFVDAANGKGYLSVLVDVDKVSVNPDGSLNEKRKVDIMSLTYGPAYAQTPKESREVNYMYPEYGEIHEIDLGTKQFTGRRISFLPPIPFGYGFDAYKDRLVMAGSHINSQFPMEGFVARDLSRNYWPVIYTDMSVKENVFFRAKRTIFIERTSGNVVLANASHPKVSRLLYMTPQERKDYLKSGDHQTSPPFPFGARKGTFSQRLQDAIIDRMGWPDEALYSE